ncbi:MAG: alpha/beta fold hydrolase, partial [Limnobacter sp.]|nr:alpha/beta fold hydrolase [Limnobacter sp.]
MDQLVPGAHQLQAEFQKQIQQAMGQAGSGQVNPATLGAIQPFMQSTMHAMQEAFSQVSLESLGHLQSSYASEMGALMASMMACVPTVNEADRATVPLDHWIEGDKRFASKDWHDHGPFEATAALYSLNARYTRKLLDLVPENLPERNQVQYALEQFISAMSPANYLVTNPEAQKEILQSKGESLKVSIENLLTDLAKGKISQTDEDAFEVGKNVATTAGSVVFENEYFQLLQYKPTTEKVGQRPMLFVPPCINKYYILDLQPANSLVAHLVSQGHTLFLVSWKNPQQEDSHFSWDGYVDDGVLTAFDVVRTISKQDKINVLGFCVGGTLLATALSTMAGRGHDHVESVTFLTTLLDFSDTGALGVFVTEEQVQAREESIGDGGLMPGKDLASAFSSLRPDDLVWNYVVNNYLKGKKPPAFDLLYWNGDSTNLPGPMFSWYLRNTYLENNLSDPGRAEVCDVPVDFGQIQAPVYILATREDHIVPWVSAYA